MKWKPWRQRCRVQVRRRVAHGPFEAISYALSGSWEWRCSCDGVTQSASNQQLALAVALHHLAEEHPRTWTGVT